MASELSAINEEDEYEESLEGLSLGDPTEESDLYLTIHTSSRDPDLLLPLACIEDSNFLKALEFDPDEPASITITAIPRDYVEFAVKYLTYTCGNGFEFEDDITDELLELSEPDSVSLYPLLITHLYGYLGINSITEFYQRMILEAINGGEITALVVQNADSRVLSSLDEPELYQVAEFDNNPYIDERLQLPLGVSPRRYLQARIARLKLALVGGITFEIRSRGRLFIAGRLAETEYPIMKVVASEGANNTGYYYYIDSQRHLFEGVISEGVPELIGRLTFLDEDQVLVEGVIDCSTNGRTTLILVEGGQVYGYGSNRNLQLGAEMGVAPVKEPRLIKMNIKCSQVVMGMDRSIFVEEETGAVYTLNENGLTRHNITQARQVIDTEAGLIYLNQDLVVIEGDGVGTVIQGDIYAIISPNLFLTSKFTVVDRNGALIHNRIVAGVVSSSHEMFLTLTGVVKLLKYQTGIGATYRLPILKGRR